MKPILKKAAWSPCAVGVGIGILSWVTFLLMFKAIGVSTTFVRFVAFIESIFSTKHVLQTEYLAKYVEIKPIFEWQFALVISIFIGAWASAKLSGVSFSFIPYLWGQNFGYSKTVRAIGAFIGGFLILFGARLAGGCTSGHGISGGLQLATSSWIFILSFFVGGIITAFALYRKR